MSGFERMAKADIIGAILHPVHGALQPVKVAGGLGLGTRSASHGLAVPDGEQKPRTKPRSETNGASRKDEAQKTSAAGQVDQFKIYEISRLHPECSNGSWATEDVNDGDNDGGQPGEALAHGTDSRGGPRIGVLAEQTRLQQHARGAALLRFTDTVTAVDVLPTLHIHDCTFKGHVYSNTTSSEITSLVLSRTISYVIPIAPGNKDASVCDDRCPSGGKDPLMFEPQEGVATRLIYDLFQGLRCKLQQSCLGYTTLCAMLEFSDIDSGIRDLLGGIRDQDFMLQGKAPQIIAH
ncbi:uncharacterized protein Z519_10482 [Cladophialophora bantiana CBS 173.52]|uniref:Uncharacterized protein n=1 Tax=Cladophialophora bantiana (strain ATCC 10958 / CBS 173.52 / CDC B-1940 / NIH 8579) TaxID=1442370 RepID=A0A0D2FR15_CLAB1|nr:uncharacterized protein Z519_10482 [Cladophialophora bantiana CBS 173.52]KIW88997.1 hypothetical protein Z519_10482 [Cladophialophora bantiana CBS 173.52]